MKRRRRSRQTRYRRTVNWKRFLLFIIIVAAILSLVLVGIHLLKGDKSPLVDILPGVTGPAKATPGQSLPAASPTPTPVPTLAPDLSMEPAAEADPAKFGFKTGIMVNGAEADSFTREGDLRFGGPEDFTSIPGILTFGGNNYRNTFTYGTQDVANKTLTRVWEQETGSLNTSMGTWTGSGWTGMPVIVQWPAATRKVLGVFDEFRNKDGFTEVIYPTMDGHIYFLELSTGKKTREPLDIGVVTKGTASLDPRGYPLLYTGQGIPSTEDGKTGAWFRIIDLIENKVVWKFGGVDPFSYRGWQAYDSSGLVNAATDTLIEPGENGVLYTIKLNSRFDPEAGTVSVNPDKPVKYRYTGDGYGYKDESNKRWPGIENSISVFHNYAFFSDNGGRLQCVDLNTLKLQYVTDITDDSDCSPVIEEDVPNNTFYIYTCNEVDKQSGALKAGKGKSYDRKIDGRTGKIIWEQAWDASYGNTSSNGGSVSTPHVGHGNIADLVIYNQSLVPVSVTQDGEKKTVQGGRIVAYNKTTGEVAWKYEQADGYWSSPVVIYDKDEKGYLLQADKNGVLRMHDALTGGVLTEIDMGSRVEATPSVFGNYLVVGTRGQYGSGEHQGIICVKIG